jgi:hypothetical protein
MCVPDTRPIPRQQQTKSAIGPTCKMSTFRHHRVSRSHMGTRGRGSWVRQRTVAFSARNRFRQASLHHARAQQLQYFGFLSLKPCSTILNALNVRTSPVCAVAPFRSWCSNVPTDMTKNFVYASGYCCLKVSEDDTSAGDSMGPNPLSGSSGSNATAPSTVSPSTSSARDRFL